MNETSPKRTQTTIRIAADVEEELRRRAEPGESANAVLRRLFGLPPNQRRASNRLRPVEPNERSSPT